MQEQIYQLTNISTHLLNEKIEVDLVASLLRIKTMHHSRTSRLKNLGRQMFLVMLIRPWKKCLYRTKL